MVLIQFIPSLYCQSDNLAPPFGNGISEKEYKDRAKNTNKIAYKNNASNYLESEIPVL